MNDYDQRQQGQQRPPQAKLDAQKAEELRKKYGWNPDRFSLLLRTVASTADEVGLEKLLYKSKALNLDPLMDQIHLVSRWDYEQSRATWDVQVGIDGLRSLADDTGEYAGQDLPLFHWSTDSNPDQVISGPVFPEGATVRACSATVYRNIKEIGKVGFGYTAYLSDYVQMRRSDGKITFMWKKVGIMLPKCAEAGAFRKGFPKQLAGLYVPEEMQFLHEEPPTAAEGPPPTPATVRGSSEKVAAAEHVPGVKDRAGPVKPQGAEAAKPAPPVGAPAKEPEKKKAPPRPSRATVPRQSPPSDGAVGPESSAPPPTTAPSDAPAPADTSAPAVPEAPTIKQMGQTIVEALRDHYKDRAGEAVKSYIARLHGVKDFFSVPAAVRDEVVKLLYLKLCDEREAGRDGGAALVTMIEEKLKEV